MRRLLLEAEGCGAGIAPQVVLPSTAWTEPPVPERAREPKRRMRMLAADVVVVRRRFRA
jgi:hypothetical protein